MASTFDQVLNTLKVEHEREIEVLRKQVIELEGQLGINKCKDDAMQSRSHEKLAENRGEKADVLQVQFTSSCKLPLPSPSTNAFSTSAYLSSRCSPALQSETISFPAQNHLYSSIASTPGSHSLYPDLPSQNTVATASVSSNPQATYKTNTVYTKSMHILSIMRPFDSDLGIDGTYSHRVAKWRRICESTEFDICISVIILVNTTIMAFEIQYDGLTIGHSVSYPGYTRPGSEIWPGAANLYDVSEKVFVAVFTLECLFKLVIFRCAYFRQAWNWLDLFVVVTGLLDLMSAAGLSIDPKFIRLMRLCKLARGLKAFKMGKFGDALQLIISSISASYSTLFWSLLVLIMFQCIAAMFINQMLTSYFEDPLQGDPGKHEVFEYFGTFTRSFVSMFEVVLANWAKPCRALIANVGEVYGIVLLLYRGTFGFSVLNVVTAVFIQQTFRVLSSHTDIMLLEKKRSENEFRKKLETLFKLADIPKDGFVCWTELESKLSIPEMRRLCFTLGIDQHDLEDIFHLLDRKGGMTTEEFLGAAQQIRRQARTIDVARLLVHSRKMGLQLVRIHQDMADLAKKFEHLRSDLVSSHHGLEGIESL